MMRVKRCVALILLSFLLVTAAAQSKTEKSEPLFHINNKPVTTAEFVYLYRKNHQHKPEEFTREKIEEYLNLFINYKLKVEEALTRKMDTTAAFRKEYRTYRDELLKPYLPDAKVIDSLVVLTYNRLKEEVNASHILVSLNPDATPTDTVRAFEKISSLRERAMAGENFETLAAEFSEEPGASTTKGNLGFFTAMQMVFPFEQAAYLTPVGKISEPVRTQFGYHIVKVNARRPSRGEVEVSHIMIRNGDDVEAAKNKIFDIYDKLRKGVKWEELCAEYSDDVNTRDKGGRLRPFGVGTMASVPSFQDAAFSLEEPGDISDPIQTQFGWHILRLESKIPLPSFGELKPSLTQRVSRDERVAISREALRLRMRKEFGYREHSNIVQELLSDASKIIDKETSSLQNLLDSTLFSMGGRRYSVRNFLAFTKGPVAVAEGPSERQQVEELITGYADHVQTELLEEKVSNESPDYKWLVREYYEGILLFEIMEQEVWNRAMEDSVGQLDYYNANAGKYVAGERMVGKVYQSTSAFSLQGLKDLLEKGGETAREYIARNRIRVDSGAFEQPDRAIFSKISWSPGTYLVESGGMHFLIWISEILPPGLQTFAEARASVISDYQTFLEDSWIRELKRKFAVKVEKRAKKRAFAQLIDLMAEE